MSAGQGGDRFRELEQAYNEYTVYDQHYEKVGKIDDIFVDANDQPEYIGVKTGLLGMKSTLIPIDLIRVNDRRKLVEVAADGEAIKNAPTFDNDGDITP
ncbi:MAG: PRC-barrel domain-containing protein, partial [Actinomycetota bacterium]|nr:PRC-barrel domain-containing protein [Actinomycetota bacterium]